MAKVFVVAPEAIKEQGIPKELYEQCQKKGMPTSDNTGGVRNSTSDFGMNPLPLIPLSDVTYRGAPGIIYNKKIEPGRV